MTRNNYGGEQVCMFMCSCRYVSVSLGMSVSCNFSMCSCLTICLTSPHLYIFVGVHQVSGERQSMCGASR